MVTPHTTALLFIHQLPVIHKHGPPWLINTVSMAAEDNTHTQIQSGSLLSLSFNISAPGNSGSVVTINSRDKCWLDLSLSGLDFNGSP